MNLRPKLLLLSLVMMCVFVILLRTIFQIQIPRGSNRSMPPQYPYALQWTIWMFVIVTVVFVIFLSFTIIRRIRAMQKQAQQIAQGSLHVRLPVKGRDELSTLAQTLNYLSDQLSKQEELRKKLMQDIAHELRTPLATLKSHMEAFLDGVWEPNQERLQSCVEEIERFETLVRAVETIHEADTSSELPRNKADLRHIVRTVVDLFESRCKSAGLELSLKAPVQPVLVWVNTDHVSQITWNLLDNAVKYTQSGGSITVLVECSERTSTLQVSDTGIGIPEQEINNVFERFYRVDKSRNRKTGGSGLGLAIVKQLVDISRGHISIISKEGEGTSVLVKWPHP